MFDPVRVLLPALRSRAAAIDPHGRTGEEATLTGRGGRVDQRIVHVARPAPDTLRPYALIELVGEPRSPLARVGEIEAQLQLSVWGASWEVERFANELAGLDGHRFGEDGDMRTVRYTRESRNVTRDSELANVTQLTDLIQCRYFSLERLAAAWP